MYELLTLNVFALSLPVALLGAGLFGGLLAMPILSAGSRPRRWRATKA
jgi:hypothetical protein